MAAFSAQDRISLDTELSNRSIKLDPQGYLLIKLDRARGNCLQSGLAIILMIKA